MGKTIRKLALLLVVGLSVALAAEYPSEFTNQGSITNTRHNMTQSSVSSAGAMRTVRNNYGEVCVYCHTPHGANTASAAPLWNRTLPTSTVYTTYDKLNTSTLTQTVYQPGAASLPCLSCHDGTQAIDAIINMPGSGQYFATPDPTQWVVWSAATGQTKSPTKHHTLVECMACHSNSTGSEVATDFTAFVIGTDLRNDHPIGVTFPATSGTGTDWKTPGGTKVVSGLTNRFFDETPNGRMDKGEIRLYDSGNGASVECASCHDPHGVPSGAVGSTFNPTFLRKSNVASAVCLTCHTK